MCDCLVALPPATGGLGARFAKNSDRPPDEAQYLEWLPPRIDRGSLRATYIDVEPAPGRTIGVLGSRPWWMWGLEHGINEAGVAIGNEAILTTLDPRGFPPRLVGMDLVRLGLERADTARASVEIIIGLLERYGQGGSGHHGVERPYWSSFLMADGSDAWVLETSGRQWEAEQVRHTRAISNRTTIPSFDAAHRDPSMPTEAATDPRLRASEAVLAAVPVTVGTLRSHLRDHSAGHGGFTVCMHAPGVAATTAGMIAELPGPGSGRRPLAHLCIGAPCTSVFVPVVVGRALGRPPAWERLAALTPGHREVLDPLEADLAHEAACGAADSDDWAPEAWRRVDECLAKVGV